MKILLKIFICVVVFTFTSFKSEAKGRDIAIFLKDSTEVKGELLAVRDSLVAIAVEPISADEDIAAYPERVKIFNLKNIISVKPVGKSFTLEGAISGLGSGVGFALLINQGGGFYRKGAVAELGIVNAIPFLIGTTLVGMGIGHLASDNEEVFTFYPASGSDSTQVKLLKEAYTFFIPRNDAIGLLKEHSRFEKSEPAYLRDTIDNLLKETK